MRPARSLRDQWEPFIYLVFVTFFLVIVETVVCVEVPQPGYIELEGIRIPLEKSLMWATTNNSDTCSISMNGTTTSSKNGSANNVTYYLNGAGLRSFSLLHGWGGNIKIYVATLYRTILEPLNTTESVNNIMMRNSNSSINQTATNTATMIDSHLLFEFTFLRNVNGRRVAEAWKYQLHHSISKEHTLYPGYQQDYNMFVHAFGAIQSGGTVSIALLSNGHTCLFDPGYNYKRTIAGYKFQLAFASMWIGSHPVTSELKSNLLGSYNSSFHSVHVTSVPTNQQQMHGKTDENVCITTENR
jgi:hypothetical protein